MIGGSGVGVGGRESGLRSSRSLEEGCRLARKEEVPARGCL